MQCTCSILSSVAWPDQKYFCTSHKGHDYWRKFIEHKICVLIFSTPFVWNITPSKKEQVRYDKKCPLVFMYNPGYSCQILMKLEFSRQIFEKSWNVIFHENPSSGSRIVSWGRTDGKADMTKLIVAFRHFANAPEKLKVVLNHLLLLCLISFCH